MTKTQKYWAERQEQKIEDLKHDWNELRYMQGGEEEDKFTVLIPVYKKQPKIRLLKLHCQSCNRKIPYDEKYVKDNLLYVTSDWTKCLCSRCTDSWKRRKEIAEAYPDFGKGVGLKMLVIDEI